MTRRPATADTTAQALWRDELADAEPTANALTAEILSYLNGLGVLAWRNNTGSTAVQSGRFVRFGRRGSGDILGVLPGGRFISIEVKAGRDRIRDEQEKWITAINFIGGVAIVARSLGDVQVVMRAEGLDREPWHGDPSGAYEHEPKREFAT